MIPIGLYIIAENKLKMRPDSTARHLVAQSLTRYWGQNEREKRERKIKKTEAK